MSPRTPCDLLISSTAILDLSHPDGRRDASIAVTGDRIAGFDTGVA